jgi:hypothetical protein
MDITEIARKVEENADRARLAPDGRLQVRVAGYGVLATSAAVLEAVQRAQVSDQLVADVVARTIASYWHGGTDHAITALSHGMWVAPEDALEEVVRHLEEDDMSPGEHVELEALSSWLRWWLQ